MGHTFALPDGRLQGYGMMNSPGLPLTIGMVLARDAGVQDPVVSHAIELSAKLLRFYTGKGAIPYGDHAAWTETHEDNGKCGMAAVLFNQLGETKSADFFTRMAVASHGNERDCGAYRQLLQSPVVFTGDRAGRTAGHRSLDAGIRWLVS